MLRTCRDPKLLRIALQQRRLQRALLMQVKRVHPRKAAAATSR
jgi:hypothetical protein